MIEMSNYYSTVNARAENIEPNSYYAIMENETWYRVRVLQCDLSCDEADVFFIDLGEEDTINVSRLYPLDRKFFSLPAQAMRVSLMGLEDFDDCESIVPVIEKCIFEGVFYMEDFSRDIDEFGPLASVVMYDTSGPDDINMNDLIKIKILQTIAPRFESAGLVAAVHACHVESNGDVFVQVSSFIYLLVIFHIDAWVSQTQTPRECDFVHNEFLLVIFSFFSKIRRVSQTQTPRECNFIRDECLLVIFLFLSKIKLGSRRPRSLGSAILGLRDPRATRSTPDFFRN